MCTRTAAGTKRARAPTSSTAHRDVAPSSELGAYLECVDANPDTWNSACNPQKKALSLCASEQCRAAARTVRSRALAHACRACAALSSLVNSVKDKCKPQIEQYERCLKANPANTETCTLHLERLWACAEGREPGAPAWAPAEGPHPPGCNCGQHALSDDAAQQSTR